FFVDGDVGGPGTFTADLDAAADADYVIGETYDIITDQGRRPFVYSGSFSFGENNVLAGAKVFLFDLADLQAISGYEGSVQEIQAYSDGSLSSDQLVAAIADALPPEAEVVSGEQATNEDADDFGEIVDIFGNVLLGFAGVALFVAAFLINNIFGIVLGQRIRELALLRAIGASARQVRASVLGESLLVGVTSSVLGLGVGVLLAKMVVKLFEVFGFSLPDLEITLKPRTIVLAFLVGVGVTVVSSISPSRRAARVPPVAGMLASHRLGEGEERRRTITGGILTALGIIAMLLGLFGNWDSALTTLLYLAPGAIFVFVGVTLLSPLFAGPFANGLGKPLRHLPWLRVSGQLAQENSARNTERTAATAGALMIGLALVGMAAVTAESLKATFRESLSTGIQADYFVRTDTFLPFGTGFAESLHEQDEFDQITAFRFGRAQVEGDGRDVLGAELDQLDGLIDPDVVSGSLADAGPGTILLHQDPAGDLGVSPGNSLRVTYANGDQEELTVAAIYKDATILNNWVIDLTSWTGARFGTASDVFIAARAADGVSVTDAAAAMDAIAVDYPQVRVENQQEFQDSQEAQLDSFLAIISGMLLLAILIAFFGIAITLALSVFERTREIGLLRAVGMTRKQVRSMVRWEAAIVSVFGALLGVVLGVVFGIGVVTALPDSIVNTIAIPWSLLAVYVVISGVAGLVAAAWPAWRAGRMNVLEAIQHL
ncbi:MAG: FtsX-like permease family protein, partial [Actinomycetota bacterium]|nr:FtsX-like permease family protein [Actinomycetota bacterium]